MTRLPARQSYLYKVHSSWMIALSAYLALYYLLSKEQSEADVEYGPVGRILEKFGKNSYCIFLIHAFIAWPFVKKSLALLERTGISDMASFIILIPVTLLAAYYAGLAFRAMIRRINTLF